MCPFQPDEDVPKISRIRTVLLRFVLQFQVLTRFLEEVHQFMNFQQSDIRGRASL